MEKPLYIRDNLRALFTVYHEPNMAIPEEMPQKIKYLDYGIIFCAPFGEEKLVSHRVLVKLARHFSNIGLPCLRFDHTGHGDSSGNFEDATLEIWKSDLELMISFAHNTLNIKNIILLGVRFGATLSYLMTTKNPLLKNLILISPIINGKEYLKLLLRSNLTTQMAAFKKIIKTREDLINELMNDQPVNVDGYLLSKDLYLQMENVNLLNELSSHAENILLLNLKKKINEPPNLDLENFSELLRKQNKNVSIEEIVSDVFWTDNNYYQTEYKNLHEVILHWVNRTLKMK